MIRGTTPTFEFTLPMLTDEIAAGYITFAQDGSVVIDKAQGSGGLHVRR